METLEELLERALGLPQADSPFTPLQMSTCVLAAKVLAADVEERVSHRELVPKLQAMGLRNGGTVVVINSNYGGVAQLGYEDNIKLGGKEMPLAPAGRKHRQPEGQGGSFNSALEPVLVPAKDSEPVCTLIAQGKQVSSYKLKYFPTTGSMQVAGVKDHHLSDGIWAIQEWVKFLNETQLLGGVAGIVPNSVRPEMMNFKFRLNKRVDRQIMNYPLILQILHGQHHVENFIGWPAPVLPMSIKDNSETSAISFKFQLGKKTPRVNLLPESGKVNFMGFPSLQFALDVYCALVDLFSRNWEDLVILCPLEDDAPPLRASEASAASQALLEQSRMKLPERDKNVWDVDRLYEELFGALNEELSSAPASGLEDPLVAQVQDE